MKENINNELMIRDSAYFAIQTLFQKLDKPTQRPGAIGDNAAKLCFSLFDSELLRRVDDRCSLADAENAEFSNYLLMVQS